MDRTGPTMTDLTPRQSQILRLIQRAIVDTGMPPTRAEIARELGFRSANAAEEHLRALARKGVIALVPGTSRGIQLKDTLREQMGQVASSRPWRQKVGTAASVSYLWQLRALRALTMS